MATKGFALSTQLYTVKVDDDECDSRLSTWQLDSIREINENDGI